MHRGLAQAFQQTSPIIPSARSELSATQHGLERSRPGAAAVCDPASNCPPYDDGDGNGVSCPPEPVGSVGLAGKSAVDVQRLDEKLRRLSGQRATAPKKRLSKSSAHSATNSGSFVAGQRIAAYEQALKPATPKCGHGAQSAPAVLTPGGPSTGRQLTDFPNEILTHVFSHLHPGSHAAVALVSRRFYALITTPHAWRMAFLRFFPGQETDAPGTDEQGLGRTETRAFSRLTQLASWRSEYLLRTRLLWSIASGKPGPVPGMPGEGIRTLQSGKKATAVITYSSQLPWMVDCLHATFVSTGKRAARVVHGASDLGVATASNPVIGKLENWGLREAYSAARIDEVFPTLTPFGLGDGPAAAPNVMDVSQLYGSIVGEGFPGGRPLYRSMSDQAFFYLENHARNRITQQEPEIPNMDEDTEAVSAVWMAKSSAVPAMTQAMVAMLAGTTLGVVSAYSLGKGDTGSRYTRNQVTARWVLSPGVPIVALQADDSFSEKRKTARRVWAVAVNALGEVFCLQDVPTATATPALLPGQRLSDVHEKQAWQAGRTARWHLVEATRRKMSGRDWFDAKNASLVLAASATPPRSSADAMQLSSEQWAAEAREMERFLALRPVTFRAVYDDWDMRCRLQVDFCGMSESVFSISCGVEKGRPARVTRHMRLGDGWQTADFSLPTAKMEITCAAADQSLYAQLAPFEDPLLLQHHGAGSLPESDVPGRRSRWLAVGTKAGAVVVWNMREPASVEVKPLRVIQTESPEVSSVAVSALFLVHGGSDGLVQAWDPLASTLEPIRTLNARSLGRVPRHLAYVRPDVARSAFSTVRAIFLDPDVTALRGVLAVGTLVRFWSYSAGSGAQSRKRQRRVRHANADGQMVSRRLGVRVGGYIASETAELRRKQEDDSRHRAWMRSRFGVGLAGLTEEEALQYAAIMSQETLLDEQGRSSGSSSGDLSADVSNGDAQSTETVMPEASMTSEPPAGPPAELLAEPDEDFELQMQRAMRLSLMEGVNDDFSVTFRPAKGKASASSSSMALGQGQGQGQGQGYSQYIPEASSSRFGVNESEDDDDLQLALALSLQEEEQRKLQEEQSTSDALLAAALYEEEEYPALEVKGKGKGRV